MGKIQELLPRALAKLQGQGYNELGLRFPLWHLHVVGSFMAYLPPKVQERYADAVTVAFTDMSAEQLTGWETIGDLDVETYLQINCTGIGNLAYVARHASDKGARVKAQQMIDKIRQFAIDNLDEIVAMIVQAAKEVVENAMGETDNG